MRIPRRAGAPGDAMCGGRSGEAGLFFNNDTGDKIILETVRSGNFFGEPAFLDGGARGN